ncbi:MAG: hypothetical protein LUF78_09750 [Clostridiales bacterium]|nr:hypothetical protein [Clostridiales bacterium]
MAIVKYKNQSGITYAYESISVWDPEKKQARPKRKYLGRGDPETGEIIPTTGKRGRPKKSEPVEEAPGSSTTDFKSLYGECAASLKKSEEMQKRLLAENEILREQNQKLEGLISSIHQLTKDFSTGS